MSRDEATQLALAILAQLKVHVPGVAAAVAEAAPARKHLVEVRDGLVVALAQANQAIALFDQAVGCKPEPVEEPVEVVEQPVVIPPPPSLDVAPVEEKPKGKWGKIWGITKHVLKVAAPVAVGTGLTATGAGAIPAVAEVVGQLLGGPAGAGLTAGGTAGAIAAGVRLYGAIKGAAKEK
jgi:hypothetical protein